MTTQYKLSIKLVQFPQILIELNCERLRKLQMRISKSKDFQIRKYTWEYSDLNYTLD